MPNFWSNGSDYIIFDDTGKVGLQSRVSKGDTIYAEDINEMRRFCEKYLLHPCNFLSNKTICRSCDSYQFVIDEVIKEIWRYGTVFISPAINQFDFIGDSCNGYQAAKRVSSGDTIYADDINDIRKVISFIVFNGINSYTTVPDPINPTQDIDAPVYIKDFDLFSTMEATFADGEDIILTGIGNLFDYNSFSVKLLQPGTEIKAKHINECRGLLEKIYYIGLYRENTKPDSTIKNVNTI